MLRIIGYILLALVTLVASYVFWLSGSSHVPVNVLAPAPYASPGGPVIVFGGTRATGLEIVRMLRERGEDVTVAVRPSSDTAALKALGVKTVLANVLDAQEVNAALASAPFKAVISTIGTSRGDQANRPDFVGNRNIIDAAKAVGAMRFVFITVIGAGDSAETAPLPARRALAEVIRLKTQAEDPQAFSYISRKDLATLALDALGDPATIGKVYAAYDPSRKTLWKMFND